MSTYRTRDPDRFIEGFQDATNAIERVEGFLHAYLLLDRETGEAVTVGMWESEAAFEANESTVAELRARAIEGSGTEVVSIKDYEVVHTADSYGVGVVL